MNPEKNFIYEKAEILASKAKVIADNCERILERMTELENENRLLTEELQKIHAQNDLLLGDLNAAKQRMDEADDVMQKLLSMSFNNPEETNQAAAAPREEKETEQRLAEANNAMEELLSVSFTNMEETDQAVPAQQEEIEEAPVIESESEAAQETESAAQPQTEGTQEKPAQQEEQPDTKAAAEASLEERSKIMMNLLKKYTR